MINSEIVIELPERTKITFIIIKTSAESLNLKVEDRFMPG